MKKLKLLLKESIFDDDIDVIDRVKNEIRRFIESNYLCNRDINISDKPNKSGKYEVSTDGDVNIRNFNINSLTNNLFEWSTVGGCFNCADCKNLKSLEGAPKIVDDYFLCNRSNSLKTLKGAPKKVSGDFSCASCINLQSLEGSPEIVKANFSCYSCKNLKSLKGAPEKVDRSFSCRGCGVKFTIDDVKKVSDVKGKIYC